MTLYHYTCDHGRRALGAGGYVLPATKQHRFNADRQARLPTMAYSWFTDLSRPNREALGLTSQLLACDRTTYRYRVTEDEQVVPWWRVRREVPESWRLVLEGAPGARPVHWWVATEPVPVTYDPVTPR